jgi:hypothetical protein
MRKLILATTIALAGVGLFAAISLGGESSSREGSFDRSFERVAVHPTDNPSASTSASAQASAKGKPKVKYFETDALPVPAAGADYLTACPSKHKALSGYFLTTGGIVPDTSAISEDSPREWVYGFVNGTGADGQAIIGVVCGKKL